LCVCGGKGEKNDGRRSMKAGGNNCPPSYPPSLLTSLSKLSSACSSHKLDTRDWYRTSLCKAR
jgi:hypothetical protein